MSIVDDTDAIAERLREIKAADRPEGPYDEAYRKFAKLLSADPRPFVGLTFSPSALRSDDMEPVNYAEEFARCAAILKETISVPIVWEPNSAFGGVTEGGRHVDIFGHNDYPDGWGEDE